MYVSDSQFTTKATVTIRVINVNDRAPQFLNTPYTVELLEQQAPQSPIVTLAAKDDDDLANDFVYQIYSTPFLDAAKFFSLNAKTGALTLKQGLDRDLPLGRPEYSVPVSVTDMGRSPDDVKLTSFTTVTITLKDLNDNAPYLAYVPGYTPLIITETLPNQFVEVYVIDNDEPINGPPFTFTLTNYSDLFKVRKPVFLGLLFFGVY